MPKTVLKLSEIKNLQTVSAEKIVPEVPAAFNTEEHIKELKTSSAVRNFIIKKLREENNGKYRF